MKPLFSDIVTPSDSPARDQTGPLRTTHLRLIARAGPQIESRDPRICQSQHERGHGDTLPGRNIGRRHPRRSCVSRLRLGRCVLRFAPDGIDIITFVDRDASEPPLRSSEDASLIDHTFAAFAIALEPAQLLSDLPPAVGRVVHTLLTAEGRLSQRDSPIERMSRHERSGTTASDSRHSLSSVSTRTDIGWRCRFRQPLSDAAPLFRLSSRRTRRSSTQPMRCSRRCSHQIATAIPTTHLEVCCSGHQIRNGYSSIQWPAHGCD